jgi:hypothetical protein
MQALTTYVDQVRATLESEAARGVGHTVVRALVPVKTKDGTTVSQTIVSVRVQFEKDESGQVDIDAAMKEYFARRPQFVVASTTDGGRTWRS